MNEWRAWLAQARSDFSHGSAIVEQSAPLCYSIAGFQQAVEKAVKGLVVALGVTSPEQSQAILGGLVSLFLGWANLNRQSVQKAEERQAEQVTSRVVAALPDEIASKILDKLAVGEYRDEENEKSVAAMLATMQANRAACDATTARTAILEDVTGNHAEHIEALWVHAAQLDGTIAPKIVKRVERGERE